MKAAIWTDYGAPNVLQLKEVEKPVPKDNEVLIKIYAATVTAGDCEMRSLNLPIFLSFPMRMYVGFKKPERIKIIGQELAGKIVSIGKDVKRFKEGDAVFAATGFGHGAYCEYVCLPEEPTEMEGVLAIKPSNMSYAEAAAIPVGGLEALHFLRKGNIQSGEKILINGAGGSIGTFAVQLAKHFGAEVTGVDSAEKLDMLRAIGANHVLDYAKEDFAANGQTYDAVFDIVGKGSFLRGMRALKKGGRFLMANPSLSGMLLGGLISLISGRKVVSETSNRKTENLLFLKELIETGKIKPIIDKRYPLEQIVEAHRYVETGHKKGGVVIIVNSDAEFPP